MKTVGIITALLLGAVMMPGCLVSHDTSPFGAGERGLADKANGESCPVIGLNTVESAVANTQRLIAEGKVQEVEFGKAMDAGVSIKEWQIEISKAALQGQDPGDTVVRNKLAKKGHDTAAFATKTTGGPAQEPGSSAQEPLQGYVVVRSDEPDQTLLVLASRDHLDFYLMNEKKELERSSISLKDVGLDGKPELVFFYDEIAGVKAIGVAIFDKHVTSALRPAKEEKTLLCAVHLNPMKSPGLKRSVTIGIYTVSPRDNK